MSLLVKTYFYLKEQIHRKPNDEQQPLLMKSLRDSNKRLENQHSLGIFRKGHSIAGVSTSGGKMDPSTEPLLNQPTWSLGRLGRQARAVAAVVPKAVQAARGARAGETPAAQGGLPGP